MAIDAADVALFTNDLRCLSHIILFGRSAKRKILLNICISVVTKVSCQSLVACLPSYYGLASYNILVMQMLMHRRSIQSKTVAMAVGLLCMT